MGSPYIWTLFAHVAFWIMLAYGWIAGRLSPAQMATTLVLWIAGYVGLARIPYLPALGAFPTYFATLDVVLLLMFASGGVRLK